MSNATPQRTPLTEEIRDLFNRLTDGQAEADLQWAHEKAWGLEPHDHWLETHGLDPDARLFLFAATAYAMRCLKGKPYRCAVLTRNMAEDYARNRA